jgi:HlyD family secretion protein
VLARVEPLGAQGAREQARTNHDAAKGNAAKVKDQLKRAEKELERTQELAKKKQANASRLDIARATVELAKAAVAAADALLVQAEVTLEQAELDLSNSVIRAPTDGFIVEQALEVGQLVTVQDRKAHFFGLATRVEKLRLEAMLPAAEAVKLQPGAFGTFTLEGVQGVELRATVRELKPPATPGGEALAVLDAENPGGKLEPGMAVKLSIIHARRPNTLRIPNASLAFQPDAALRARFPPSADSAGRTAVWVLDEDGEPVQRIFVPGITDGAHTEVVGGSVGLGDRIVLRAWVDGP